jgi:hypothetical protein
MKKTETILGILTAIALILNLLRLPGGGVFSVLMLSLLANFYMYLSFALFNGIPLRKIFKKESYQNLNKLRILGAVFMGMAIATTLMGVLFKFQSFPGANEGLIFGLFLLMVALIVSLIKNRKSPSAYYKLIFNRIAIFGVVSAFLIFMPREKWLEIRHPNHPEYVQAVKEAWADPNNQEKWDRVEEERKKMAE